MKVVIVGAGVAGLSIGWRLRQAGVAVTILERALPAHGATWAAAGMLAATAEYEEAQSPESELAYRARRLWPDFAHEIEDASGISIGYRQGGSLTVAMNVQEAANHAARAAADPDLKPLTAEQARAMEPMLAPEIAGALWAAKESDVDNRALGQALVRAFVRAGGTLAIDEAVVRIETHAGCAVAARTPFGLYEADAFILAAGAWSGLIEGLPPEAIPPVRPTKGEMLALAPPAGAALPGHVVWGNEVYLIPRDDRLLIGATSEDACFDTGLTDAAEAWLSSRALALMPALCDWKIAEHWAGLRPGSPDGLPMLGPSAVSGLFIATGQYRNGILFAPVVADILSGLLLERPVDFAAFDPRRFSVGPDFSLHPRLESGTIFVADWSLSRVLLMNDARYPWLVLVPRRANATEVFDLSAEDRATLIEEIARATAGLKKLSACAKINVGSLGNLVPQLHIHIVARNPGDPAWPGPVWGHGSPVPYERDVLEKFVQRAANALVASSRT